LQVVGTAINGREAVEQVKRLKPDVVTMDVEMPQMNGIEAVRIIMREAPTNVLMLSSLTHEGARVTLQALEAGAADYLPKDIRAWMDKNSGVRGQLIDRLVALGSSRRFRRSTALERSFPGREQPGTTMVFRPDDPAPSRPQRSTSRTPTAGTPSTSARSETRSMTAPSARSVATSAPATSTPAAGAAAGNVPGGHRCFYRWPGSAAESVDPAAGELSLSGVAGAAHAQDLHPGICRAVESAVSDQGEGS
jgi:two-component system chemotaxis response regulator CheB